jgi:hypothetical protein
MVAEGEREGGGKGRGREGRRKRERKAGKVGRKEEERRESDEGDKVLAISIIIYTESPSNEIKQIKNASFTKQTANK